MNKDRLKKLFKKKAAEVLETKEERERTVKTK